jgi:hypothetical protein
MQRVALADRRYGDGPVRIPFKPEILPPYARRSKSIDMLIPVLYLIGVSTGDFAQALAALLGKDAPLAALEGRAAPSWLQYRHPRNGTLHPARRRYADTSSRTPKLDSATIDMAECANRANVGVGQPQPGPLQKLQVANRRCRCRCGAGADLRQSREALRIARTLHVPRRRLDRRAPGHGRRLARSP